MKSLKIKSKVNHIKPQKARKVYREMHDFYIYLYLDTRKSGTFKFKQHTFNLLPFYVGEGRANRCLDHVHEAISSDKNSLKLNTIRKIIHDTGSMPEIILYKENLTLNEAFVIEKQLIKDIGRRHLSEGPLANITDGGDGGDTISAHPNRKEILKKLSIYWSGKNNPMYGIHRYGEQNPFYGKTHTDEFKKKMSKLKKSKPITAEHKEKIRQSLKDKPLTDEHKQKLRNAHSGVIKIIFQKDGVIEKVASLRRFAIKYNLSTYFLKRLIKNKMSDYQGWTVLEIRNINV